MLLATLLLLLLSACGVDARQHVAVTRTVTRTVDFPPPPPPFGSDNDQERAERLAERAFRRRMSDAEPGRPAMVSTPREGPLRAATEAVSWTPTHLLMQFDFPNGAAPGHGGAFEVGCLSACTLDTDLVSRAS